MDLEAAVSGRKSLSSVDVMNNNNNNTGNSKTAGEGSVVEVGCFEDEQSSAAVDWKGRPSSGSSHGGMKAATFVLGLQAFEIMAIAAVGNNLITYVINEMHFPLSKSANIVTNFIGTIFLLSLFGGYLSDSYLGSFWTMLIFGFVELSGFTLLAVQAHIPQLKPTTCNMLLTQTQCNEPDPTQSAIFFTALYLVALGSGCVKPNMIAHGADQFINNKSDTSSADDKRLSTYFNFAYFAFSVGELVALTVLVWVQTHSGMDIGFGISAAAMGLGLVCLVAGTPVYRNKRPQGSIFTPIAQVIVAAIAKRKQVYPSNLNLLHGNNLSTNNNNNTLVHTDRFRFLDKACIRLSSTTTTKQESPWQLTTVTQVEQLKTLISILPIFASTIIFNTILAQLQTFSVQQGSQMNNHLLSITIPPASLQSIPYILLLIILPLYNNLFVPFARRITNHPSGITPLQRIGTGLFISTFSMITAAIIERKRQQQQQLISIFWITPQYIIFGVSEMLTAVGLIEFFYKQSVGGGGMQAFLTSITYCSYSFGFYLSSVLVELVNRVTTTSDQKNGWLSENDLNKDRLDLFYWMLAGLSFLNFCNYLFWANWFTYNPAVNRDHGTTSVQKMDDDQDGNCCYKGTSKAET